MFTHPFSLYSLQAYIPTFEIQTLSARAAQLVQNQTYSGRWHSVLGFSQKSVRSELYGSVFHFCVQ
jgi:hypothetical protein